MANDIYGNLNILDSALSDSVVEAAESEDGIKNLISSDGGDPSDYYIWERKLVFGEQTKWVAKKRVGAGGVSSIFENTEDFGINECYTRKWCLNTLCADDLLKTGHDVSEFTIKKENNQFAITLNDFSKSQKKARRFFTQVTVAGSPLWTRVDSATIDSIVKKSKYSTTKNIPILDCFDDPRWVPNLNATPVNWIAQQTNSTWLEPSTARYTCVVNSLYETYDGQETARQQDMIEQAAETILGHFGKSPTQEEIDVLSSVIKLDETYIDPRPGSRMRGKVSLSAKEADILLKQIPDKTASHPDNLKTGPSVEDIEGLGGWIGSDATTTQATAPTQKQIAADPSASGAAGTPTDEEHIGGQLEVASYSLSDMASNIEIVAQALEYFANNNDKSETPIKIMSSVFGFDLLDEAKRLRQVVPEIKKLLKNNNASQDGTIEMAMDFDCSIPNVNIVQVLHNSEHLTKGIEQFMDSEPIRNAMTMNYVAKLYDMVGFLRNSDPPTMLDFIDRFTLSDMSFRMFTPDELSRLGSNPFSNSCSSAFKENGGTLAEKISDTLNDSPIKTLLDKKKEDAHLGSPELRQTVNSESEKTLDYVGDNLFESPSELNKELSGADGDSIFKKLLNKVNYRDLIVAQIEACLSEMIAQGRLDIVVKALQKYPRLADLMNSNNSWDIYSGIDGLKQGSSGALQGNKFGFSVPGYPNSLTMVSDFEGCLPALKKGEFEPKLPSGMDPADLDLSDVDNLDDLDIPDIDLQFLKDLELSGINLKNLDLSGINLKDLGGFDFGKLNIDSIPSLELPSLDKFDLFGGDRGSLKSMTKGANSTLNGIVGGTLSGFLDGILGSMPDFKGLDFAGFDPDIDLGGMLGSLKDLDPPDLQKYQKLAGLDLQFGEFNFIDILSEFKGFELGAFDLDLDLWQDFFNNCFSKDNRKKILNLQKSLFPDGDHTKFDLRWNDFLKGIDLSLNPIELSKLYQGNADDDLLRTVREKIEFDFPDFSLGFPNNASISDFFKSMGDNVDCDSLSKIALPSWDLVLKGLNLKKWKSKYSDKTGIVANLVEDLLASKNDGKITADEIVQATVDVLAQKEKCLFGALRNLDQGNPLKGAMPPLIGGPSALISNLPPRVTQAVDITLDSIIDPIIIAFNSDASEWIDTLYCLNMDYWDNYEGHYHKTGEKKLGTSLQALQITAGLPFEAPVNAFEEQVAKANGSVPSVTGPQWYPGTLYTQLGVADEVIESIIEASVTSTTMPLQQGGTTTVLMYDVDRFNYPTPFWARTEPLKQLAKLALMAGLPGMPKKEIACEYFSLFNQTLQPGYGIVDIVEATGNDAQGERTYGKVISLNGGNLSENTGLPLINLRHFMPAPCEDTYVPRDEYQLVIEGSTTKMKPDTILPRVDSYGKLESIDLFDSGARTETVPSAITDAASPILEGANATLLGFDVDATARRSVDQSQIFASMIVKSVQDLLLPIASGATSEANIKSALDDLHTEYRSTKWREYMKDIYNNIFDDIVNSSLNSFSALNSLTLTPSTEDACGDPGVAIPIGLMNAPEHKKDASDLLKKLLFDDNAKTKQKLSPVREVGAETIVSLTIRLYIVEFWLKNLFLLSEFKCSELLQNSEVPIFIQSKIKEELEDRGYYEDFLCVLENLYDSKREQEEELPQASDREDMLAALIDIEMKKADFFDDIIGENSMSIHDHLLRKWIPLREVADVGAGGRSVAIPTEHLEGNISYQEAKTFGTAYGHTTYPTYCGKGGVGAGFLGSDSNEWQDGKWNVNNYEKKYHHGFVLERYIKIDDTDVSNLQRSNSSYDKRHELGNLGYSGLFGTCNIEAFQDFVEHRLTMTGIDTSSTVEDFFAGVSYGLRLSYVDFDSSGNSTADERIDTDLNTAPVGRSGTQTRDSVNSTYYHAFGYQNNSGVSSKAGVANSDGTSEPGYSPQNSIYLDLFGRNNANLTELKNKIREEKAFCISEGGPWGAATPYEIPEPTGNNYYPWTGLDEEDKPLSANVYVFPLIESEVCIDPTTTLGELMGGNVFAGWEESYEQLLTSLKESEGYDLLFNYCFQIKRNLEITSIFSSEMLSRTQNLEDRFTHTKRTLEKALHRMTKGGAYDYRDPDIKKKGGFAGEHLSALNLQSAMQSGASGNDIDFEKLMIQLRVKTPFLILQGLCEQFDPCVSIAAKIVDAMVLLDPGLSCYRGELTIGIIMAMCFIPWAPKPTAFGIMYIAITMAMEASGAAGPGEKSNCRRLGLFGDSYDKTIDTDKKYTKRISGQTKTIQKPGDC